MTESQARGVSGTVLVVDDSQSERELVGKFISAAHPGIEILEAANGPTALQTLAHNEVDLVILDYRLPVVDGLEVLKHIVANYPQMVVIMATGLGSQEVAVKALNLGAADYVAKSLGYHKSLPMLVQRHLRQSFAANRQKLLETQYEKLVENSRDPIYQLQGNHFVYVNKAFEERFGYDRETLTDPDFSMTSLLTEESRKLVAQRQRKLEQGEELPNLYRFTALTSRGEPLEVETNVSYLLQADGGYLTQGVLRVLDQRETASVEVALADRAETGEEEVSPLAEIVPQVNNHLAYARANLANLAETLELGCELTATIRDLSGITDPQTALDSLKRLKPVVEDNSEVFAHGGGELKAALQGLDRVVELLAKALKPGVEPVDMRHPVNVKGLFSR